MIKTLLPFILFVVSFNCFSQSFSRIEDAIGLDAVPDTNGIAVADYDNDNDLDLFVVAIEKDVEGEEKTHSKLFRNNNDGTYTNVTEESGLTNLLPTDELDHTYDLFKGLNGYKFGVSWGDYNNDGFVDIFFTHLAKVQLFKNLGDGTFTEVTEDAGITRRNECGNTGATWFDFNNDGYLDLYFADWEQCSYNTLYQNNGDETFTDVSEIIREYDVTYTASYTPFPFDFNEDGFMDLYLSVDLHDMNQLFLNNENFEFNQVAESYGLNNDSNDMGIAISDYNGDGLFDFYVTAIDENFLFTNQGDNTFTENAIDFQIGRTGWAWGTTFADFDLDSDEDLIVVNGFHIPSRGPEPNTYYENRVEQGEDFFEKPVGIEDIATSVEVIDFDYDNDGDLDLVISNTQQNLHFYENKIITDPENPVPYLQWLKVSLQGTVSNRDAIGTILELGTTQKTIKRYYCGVGMLGQSIKPVHFGLRPESDITYLKITWPSGIVETHTGINPNSYIKATESQGYEVIDSNFAEKPQGCTDPDSCNYDPNAIVDDGSCEYLIPNASISGASSSGYFETETYSFPINSSQTIQWSVEGGEIVSDDDESTIRVKWGFEPQALVSAVISNSTCSSEDIIKNVSLNIDQINETTSIARIWNEAVLFAIREDYARPTVHARNLFHTSAAMYDIWAILHGKKTHLIGNELNGFTSEFSEFPSSNTELRENLETAISYAVFRLIRHRFTNSPHLQVTYNKVNSLMYQLGYDASFSETNYQEGNAAALGNYVAQQYIQYGLSDGSRESSAYTNAYYQPVNAPLAPVLDGNPTISDPNHWQSLSLDTYIDQSGNVIEGSSIDFLSPEWGNVSPFALTTEDQIIYNRDGNNYIVYHDPDSPPHIGSSTTAADEAYKWGFSLVSVWSSHLDPFDEVMWDISPNSIGNLNIEDFPDSYTTFPQFYDIYNGGVISQGHSQNPITGQEYEEQIVPRGDYTRVLAEYWADGPDSETPPGHWYTILNTMVNDHPSLIRKFEGEGEELSPLEWDIKAYFLLGGAMHDAAITAWSIKGWYDYIRPISAIRYMTDMGQSTDMSLPNYHPNGISLIDGFIEVVEEGDPLEGRDGEHIGKIKLLAWKGHNYINNTEVDQAGVDWILAEQWWPYQRPSFVTPPFAGYVSGHSTYSRAAAEVLTLFTGSEFFPGGLGEFHAKKNKFLVFEEGPSTDITLQWATYRDASDQCSLSRIWGGIHPPVDDIPGRFIGEKVGVNAYNKGITFFEDKEVDDPGVIPGSEMVLYPNPVSPNGQITILNSSEELNFSLFDMQGRTIAIDYEFDATSKITTIQVSNLSSGVYVLASQEKEWKIIVY